MCIVMFGQYQLHVRLSVVRDKKDDADMVSAVEEIGCTSLADIFFLFNVGQERIVFQCRDT